MNITTHHMYAWEVTAAFDEAFVEIVGRLNMLDLCAFGSVMLSTYDEA